MNPQFLATNHHYLFNLWISEILAGIIFFAGILLFTLLACSGVLKRKPKDNDEE